MIYLDYAATTPLDPRVYEVMRRFLEPGGIHGNPASDHAAGRAARGAVDEARAHVAALLGATPAEIVFTSGSTEANNLALKGALEFLDPAGRGAGRHVVTSRTEHKSVLETCRHLETRGVRVSYLVPGVDGRVTAQQVRAALTPETALVSLMWVNNEIGTVNDVEALAPALRERGILFHVDAVQAAGKIAIDLARVPIDLLSLSAHKFYGPKGVGALFVRKKPRARLAPQMHGSGHEQGMRSGTLPTHQLAGLGEASRLALAERVEEDRRLRALRERLERALTALPDTFVNGAGAPRAPGILNVSFGDVEGESLRAGLPDLAVSSGSACSSATRESSYVLRALGRDDALAGASLRFSLGRFTTEAEVDAAGAQVGAQVLRLRALWPAGRAA
ncbi:MAG TPA: aminotransferase class V-fold PLP-dependent enzyme [Verrucomicrobiae bacterium]|nr:aminotransferase class V-fold PLP-dependent enzyme [Verrucomicrobiae bacterium]